MKRSLSAVLFVASLMPFAAHAQSTASHVTRAQVRAELVQLESVGYNPAARDENYPQALQAAEEKVTVRYGDSATFGGAQSITHAEGAAPSEAARK
jgi:hypothetical protein